MKSQGTITMSEDGGEEATRNTLPGQCLSCRDSGLAPAAKTGEGQPGVCPA